MAISAAEGRALAQAGIEALKRGDALGAREQLTQAIAAGRNDAPVWLALALACRQAGDNPAMLAAAEEVLARDKTNLQAVILKADGFAASGDARTASTLYRAAARMAPPDYQLPAELRGEVRRARALCDEYAAKYESFLRERLDAAPSARFGQSLDLMFGKKQIFYQQPLFYYFPELPQIQFYPRADFPWLDAVEAATDDIRAELFAVLADDGAFHPYVESAAGSAPKDYQGMLGNPAWSAFYLWKNGAPVPQNMARCPRTMAALKDVPLSHVPGRSPSILFSLLKPGARIPPHHGFVNTRLICHLPLIVPEGCVFRVGNETRPWREGRAWAFDDTIEHEAHNASGETRVILLFDVWRPELSEAERQAVATMFAAIDAYGAGGAAWDS